MSRFFRLLIILITLTVSIVYSSTYSKKAPVFYGDGLGYYVYLPAVFIYDNFTSISKAPTDDLGHVFDNPDGGLKTPKGYIVIQYTYGVALMEAPFFLLAHAYEKAAGLPANGYSDTYKAAIHLSTIVYALLGMWLVYLVLRRYFNTTHSLLTLSFLFIGTNLFWFTLHQAGMSHVPLFFLYALLIYLSIQLHEKPTTRNFILTGLVAAMITLVRPSDILCLIIPLLYNVHSRHTMREKIAFLRKNIWKILLVAPLAFLLFVPQLAYWKFISGSYFFDSYKGQNFNWSDPKIIEGLFYPGNGWLVYSPIMVFSLIGFVFYKTIKKWAWCIYLLFPAYIYVIYSWFCFNYINGLGSRPMIHLYPLLAIPLAAMILYISRKNLVAKSVFGALSVLFIIVNISYSMKAAEWKIDSANSNFPYNLQTMFKKNLNYTDMVVADIGMFQPDTADLTRIAVLSCEHFNDSTSPNYVRDTADKDNFVYHLPADLEYHENGIFLKYNKALFKDAKWLKCRGRFMLSEHWGPYYQHVLVLDIRRGDHFVEWVGCQIDNKIGIVEDENLNRFFFRQNTWGEVYYFVKVPKDIQDGDEVRLTVWNMAKRSLVTDFYCLELYK